MLAFMRLVWSVVFVIAFFVVLNMLFKWFKGDKYAFTPDGIIDDEDEDGDFGERRFMIREKAVSYAKRWNKFNHANGLNNIKISVWYDFPLYDLDV